jgi:hypothetical protein
MKHSLIILCFLLYAVNFSYAYKLPKAYGIVHVTDHGAIPDDGIDDTNAIQAAIEYAKSLQPDGAPAHNVVKEKHVFVVYLPAGTYDVQDMLFIDPSARENKSFRIILMGEDKETTIIRLKDNCPGFTNIAAPKPVWRTINASKSNVSQNYAIADLTFNIGYGNPGAIAVDHFNNNLGSVKNVKIVCPDLDNKGFIGFKFDRETGGICYIHNMEVVGFETGIKTGDATIDLVFENVQITDCNVGFRNDKKGIQLKDFTTTRVPTPIHQTNIAASMILINAELHDGNSTADAIIRNAGQLYLRNVRSHGFKTVCAPLQTDYVEEYIHGQQYSLWDTQALGSLKLPMKDVPDPVREPISEWTIIDCDAQGDDTQVIQNAIDAGAKTIFLTGKKTIDITNPIILRNNIERFHGGWGKLWFGQLGVDKPALIVETGNSPHVIIECFGYLNGIQNNSAKDVVIRSLLTSHIRLNYETTAENPGDLYIEEVCPRWNSGNAPPLTGTSMLFRNQDVYIRDLNIEGFTNPITAYNSTIWMFGFKFGEQVSNPAIRALDNCRVEVLGGLLNGANAKNRKIFIIEDSEMSITGVFTKNGGDDATAGIFVSETQSGVTRTMNTTDLVIFSGNRTHCPFFRSQQIEPTGLSENVYDSSEIKVFKHSNGISIHGLSKHYDIEIFDISGKIIYKNNSQVESIEIPLSQGFYLVRTGMITTKITI